MNEQKTLEHAREEIDEEIQTLLESLRSPRKDTHTDVLEDSIRALRTKRNTLAPISCLPPETLCDIFAFASADQKTFDIVWIGSISHVCKHWRDVALACPDLWVHIFPDRYRWAEELLKRSRLTPLIVAVDIGYRPSPKVLESVWSVMRHARRFRELRVNATESDIMRIFPLTQPTDTPFLETLSLCLHKANEPPNTKHVYTFPGIHLALRSLELLDCSIRWDSTNLSGLAHLTLHRFKDIFPTFPQLLDILGRIPTLETLYLNDVRRNASIPRPRPANRVISLPCLTLFRSASRVLECAQLLDHLTYPPVAHLKLFCVCENMTNIGISCIVPALSKVRENEEGIEQPVRCLAIAKDRMSHFWLQAWTGPCFSKLSEGPQFDVKLKLLRSNTGNNLNPIERVASQLCRALSWTHLDTLHVSNIHFDATEWLEIFGGLIGLKTIRTCSPTACGIVDAIIKGVDESSTASDEHGQNPLTQKTEAISAYFPALRVLILENVYFYDEEPEQYLDMDRLHTCLTQRRAVEIEELHLIRCHHIDGADVDLLSRTIKRVEWDGIGQD